MSNIDPNLEQYSDSKEFVLKYLSSFKNILERKGVNSELLLEFSLLQLKNGVRLQSVEMEFMANIELARVNNKIVFNNSWESISFYESNLNRYRLEHGSMTFQDGHIVIPQKDFDASKEQHDSTRLPKQELDKNNDKDKNQRRLTRKLAVGLMATLAFVAGTPTMPMAKDLATGNGFSLTDYDDNAKEVLGWYWFRQWRESTIEVNDSLTGNSDVSGQ